MQDIDFGRFRYSEKARASRITTSHGMGSAKKVFVFTIAFFIVFTMGALGGVYISQAKTAETDFLDDGMQGNLMEQSGQDASIEPNDKLISRNQPPIQDTSHLNSSQKKNTSLTNLREKLSQKDRQKTYLIWAKTYQNKMTAYRHGHFLKKQNFPVFLAKSGDKMKLYIGPISGKPKAYQTLAKIKKWTPFKAAILHKKTE